VPEAARSVVYVLDRSVSMGLHDALAAARGELLAGLRRLPATTRFQVIPYNHRAEPLYVDGRADLLPADPATLGQVARAVEALQPSGGSDHGQALRRGLAFRPDLLFLVTDADDLRPDEVLAVTRFNRGRTVIHTVELSRRPPARGDSPLRRLAAGNGGTYRCAPPGR
jgi:hypothetical protein